MRPGVRHGFGPRKQGFTLIEVLIVILVIAALALIVIPRLLGAGRKAKEGALRGDLHQLRNAIEQFEADTGDHPATLDQLMAAKDTPPSGSGGSGLPLDSSAYRGPYLRNPDRGLPKDAFTGAADWSYTPATGEVHSSSTLESMTGEAYSSW
jgi:general secretion pathway protein G